jgi:hemoglobin
VFTSQGSLVRVQYRPPFSQARTFGCDVWTVETPGRWFHNSSAASENSAMAQTAFLTLYAKLGGESGVSRLVERFYDIVESDPAGAPLVALHNIGHGIAHARQAQFEFLSGFLGGPQLYIEHHGHSNVRKMHEHLAVTTVERDSWIACMAKALAAHDLDNETRAALLQHFTRVANMLVNRP